MLVIKNELSIRFWCVILILTILLVFLKRKMKRKIDGPLPEAKRFKMQKARIILTIDCEAAGRNPFKHPTIQAALALMELTERNEINVMDTLNVCIAFEKGDEWEERCEKTFWQKQDPDGEIRMDIMKNSIPKKQAADKIYHFVVNARKKHPDLKYVSDNSAYDYPLISEFLLQRHGYPPLHYIMEPLNKENIEGKHYSGFPEDSGSFIKGVCYMRGITKQMYKDGIKEEFEEFMKREQQKIDFTFKLHSAIYDAIKIGFEYLKLF